MSNRKFHSFLHRQIPVLILLSLLPGLGYVFLGYLYGLQARAIIWYGLIVLVSLWGYSIYKEYAENDLGKIELNKWYNKLSIFYYSYFFLWLLIFLFYIGEAEYKLHYIAIFTEIGAAVVASALLMPDKKLYRPNIIMLMIPLAIYFLLIGEWFGYVLSIFSVVFLWVLLYAANSSHQLLMKNYHQANFDFLTGLRNRYNFISSLQQLFASVQSSKQFIYLVLIDLDHFKTINDSLGHDIGDKLLKEVSLRIRDSIQHHDLLARLGGDEFIIAGNEYTDKASCKKDAEQLARILLLSLKESYNIDRHNLYISASIGITLVDEDNVENAERLIKEADIAMYEVKKNGRDGVILFDEELSERVEHNLKIERLLHFSVEKNEIFLVYQPQLDKNKKVVGAETLVRWNSDEMGLIQPDDFIPIAERTGFIIELGRFIIETAFKTLSTWHRQGVDINQFSINLSMRQFFYYDFIDDIKLLCEEYLTAELRQKVVFEMTESILVQDFHKVADIMNEIKQLGIRFSMDDFGTGYSSLTYLKELPIDEIKIDRSFVNGLNTVVNNQVMVNSILDLANQFNLSVVAEGVENIDQFDYLESHNCNVYQGFCFSKPLTDAEFLEYYRQN